MRRTMGRKRRRRRRKGGGGWQWLWWWVGGEQMTGNPLGPVYLLCFSLLYPFLCFSLLFPFLCFSLLYPFLSSFLCGMFSVAKREAGRREAPAWRWGPAWHCRSSPVGDGACKAQKLIRAASGWIEIEEHTHLPGCWKCGVCSSHQTGTGAVVSLSLALCLFLFLTGRVLAPKIQLPSPASVRPFLIHAATQV